MPRKPSAHSARARFAASLAWHLDHGTRPNTAAGKPWTDTEFADEVPTTHVKRAGSRKDEPARSPRSVANWRTGAALPEDIDLISRALFGPSDRHASARETLRQAFLEARAEKLGRARPDPAGPRWVPAAETFAIDRAVTSSDEVTAAAPMQRQLQAAVARYAEALAEAAERLSNSRTFGEMAAAAAALRALAAVDPQELAAGLGEAYVLSLELGGFLEADANLRADPDVHEPPLAPDIHHKLKTLVQTAAPWLRAFPSIAKWDDEAGKALARPILLAPAYDFFRRARAADAISAEDATEMQTLAKAGEESGFLRQKAGILAVAGAKNLMLAAGALVAAYQAGTDAAVLEERTTLVRRAAATLANAEAEVEALAPILPSDVAQALRAVVQGARRVGALASAVRPSPPEPVVPDDVEKRARAIILNNHAPPATWRPFIRRLYLGQVIRLTPLVGLSGLQELHFGGPVRDLAPLAGLSDLRELELEHTNVSDLAPLAGLFALQQIYIHNSPVTDLSPLADLPSLHTLRLTKTKVSDLSPLAGVLALRTLILDNTQVSDLAALAGLSKLQKLYLENTKVNDLGPLTGLYALRELRLSNTQVSDLAPLAGLPNLKNVCVESETRRAKLAKTLGRRGGIVSIFSYNSYRWPD